MDQPKAFRTRFVSKGGHLLKPTLYHDIDGVLFGEYAGHFQLRPNVKGWLHWVHEHFNVVWLTTWERHEIRTLLSIVYGEKFLNTLEAPAFHVADWYGHPDKESWLAAGDRFDHAQGEWFWIDDDRPSDERLNALGLEPSRCLRVNPKGADELENLQLRLQLLHLPNMFTKMLESRR